MKKSNLQLLSNFADASDELLKLKVITTDSFTGEIGEYIACNHFKLVKSPRVTKEIDATDSNGNHYQVKSKIVSKSNFGYRISGLNPKAFKYLVIVYFDELYNPLKILKIDSKVISGSDYNVPNNVTANQNVLIVEGSGIKVTAKVKSALTKFAEAYSLLRTHKIIRTRHIVGDLGESYACEKLGLKINERSNEKGIDAVHPTNGLTFEIKTRRVYQSERRIGEGRRINGLTGKSADFLIVVTLNREFMCSGMWIMPMKNIENPKSAHLTIVNHTIGVESIVPSQVDWLKTGKTFTGFKSKSMSVTNPVALKSNSLKSILEIPKAKVKVQNPPNQRKYKWMTDDSWDDVEPPDKKVEFSYPSNRYPKQSNKTEEILKQLSRFAWYLIFATIAFTILFRGCF